MNKVTGINANKIMPSMIVSCKSYINMPATAVTNNSKGSSIRIKPERIGRAQTMAVIPSTNPMFAMLEPTALPTAKPGASFKAELMATMISGADVPKLTTVKPIIKVDIPSKRAVDAAEFTN